MDIEKTLELHQLGLVNDQKGEKADLREANLRGANLWEANLWGANLREANLGGARGIWYFGFDERGYVLICWNRNNERWFNAGCRSFSADEALAHWSNPDYPDQKRGQQYVNIIKFAILQRLP